MDARSANQSLCTLTKAGRSPVAFHKPGDFTRLVPFRHFDSCKGTLSTRWHPGGPSAILSPAHRICTAYHLKLHYPAMSCYVPVIIHLTAQERKDQNSIGFVPPMYLWETTETDMIILPTITVSPTTVPFQKLKYKYTMHLVVTRPLINTAP